MAGKSEAGEALRIGDDAVQARTGKTWAEWFKVLDAAGCRRMNHKQIVAQVGEQGPKLDGWWCQMVTVGYEQARGLRARHEKPEGFQISGSKTVAVPVTTLFMAWQDEKTRKKWLPDGPIVIRKATPDKSMRITWVDGTSSVEVNFYPKGNGKSQVAVQHGKLPDAKEAARKKAYWAERLNDLKMLFGS